MRCSMDGWMDGGGSAQILEVSEEEEDVSGCYLAIMHSTIYNERYSLCHCMMRMMIFHSCEDERCLSPDDA